MQQPAQDPSHSLPSPQQRHSVPLGLTCLSGFDQSHAHGASLTSPLVGRGSDTGASADEVIDGLALEELADDDPRLVSADVRFPDEYEESLSNSPVFSEHSDGDDADDEDEESSTSAWKPLTLEDQLHRLNFQPSASATPPAVPLTSQILRPSNPRKRAFSEMRDGSDSGSDVDMDKTDGLDGPSNPAKRPRSSHQ